VSFLESNSLLIKKKWRNFLTFTDSTLLIVSPVFFLVYCVFVPFSLLSCVSFSDRCSCPYWLAHGDCKHLLYLLFVLLLIALPPEFDPRIVAKAGSKKSNKKRGRPKGKGNAYSKDESADESKAEMQVEEEEGQNEQKEAELAEPARESKKQKKGKTEQKASAAIPAIIPTAIAAIVPANPSASASAGKHAQPSPPFLPVPPSAPAKAASPSPRSFIYMLAPEFVKQTQTFNDAFLQSALAEIASSPVLLREVQNSIAQGKADIALASRATRIEEMLNAVLGNASHM
jgi:hypothetical protein